VSDEIRQFCVRCFADDKGGSWGDGVYGDAKHGTLCANCGAGNCAIEIPEWAVKSIREQASWVGKRYYPIDEDRERSVEIRYLRGIAPPQPGITATRSDDEKHPDWWHVQCGRVGVGPIVASTEAEAIEKGRLSLPYPVPENAHGDVS
jgi:hypothetical protein